MNIKQVIVVARKFPDGKGGILNPRTGKMIAQAGHASLEFLRRRVIEAIKNQYQDGIEKDLEEHLKLTPAMIAWMCGGYRKICLQVETPEDLVELHKKAVEIGLESNLIKDLGYTEFKGETITALAIGPNVDSDIDALTSHLRLM